MMPDPGKRLSRRAALALGAGATAALLGGCSTASVPSAPAVAMPSFPGNAAPALLIDPPTLFARVTQHDPTLLLLDAGELNGYNAGHIPGAIHTFWQETIERDDPIYGVVLNRFDAANRVDDQGKRLEWMRRHGVSPEREIVVYDHGDGRRAARLVWFLRFLGHDRVAALDGGVAAWRGAGYKTSIDASAPSSLSEPAVSPRRGYYLSTGEVPVVLADSDSILVDIRSDAELHDTVNGQLPLGRIPSSVRAPWPSFVRDRWGRFIAPADALATLRQTGATPNRRVILYGRFGVDADQMWLLFKLLGYSRVLVYDRGWAEWAQTSGFPKEGL